MRNTASRSKVHDFSLVPKATIPRAKFDRSHGNITTMDEGILYPIFWDHVLPGDTFNLNMTAVARLATPIYPIMDNIRFQSFFFFVPYRILFPLFEKMCGAQDNPDDSTDYIFPVLNQTTAFSSLSLADYFGLPVGVAIPNADRPNSILFRAYNRTWNDWFRDENLQDSVQVDTGAGPDDPTKYTLLRVGKIHDYFTSALPWPQKGDAVTLFNAADLPIVAAGGVPGVFRRVDTDALTGSGSVTVPSGNGQVAVNSVLSYYDPNGSLEIDTSESGATTINGLRQAFALQKALERDARGGTRFKEIIQSHFGVSAPDFRLQRPEYLGGGITPVIVHQVPQMSSTDTTTPQGNLAAYGTMEAHGHGFIKSFVEHGVIIGLGCFRGDLKYQQGMERQWSYSTRWDIYWPAFAHIGEQAVLNKEIYFQNDTVANNQVFGYQERHAEWRYKPSRITGLMRSNVAGSLDAWHIAQDFESLPALNADFIQENAPVDRVIAVPSAPHFIFDSYFKLICARPMPMYSVPGYIDHF